MRVTAQKPCTTTVQLYNLRCPRFLWAEVQLSFQKRVDVASTSEHSPSSTRENDCGKVVAWKALAEPILLSVLDTNARGDYGYGTLQSAAGEQAAAWTFGGIQTYVGIHDATHY